MRAGMIVTVTAVALVGSVWWVAAAPVAVVVEEDPALERTRKQVRMLDDIYKGTIVLITDTYVDEDSDVAAGRAFKKVFQIAKDKGYHEVRLIDATGEPYSSANEPRDEFEKEAIQKLKDGETFVEQVIERDGQRFLRVATPIPVVMDKCIMCHSNYKDVPEGQPIGALGYIVPIE